MKKSYSRALSVLLCAALVFFACPITARAVTLTAVNDTLLPLADSTMPDRMGGETYVPYSVFTSLGVASNYEDGVLTLSSGENLLSFSTAEGYVYDQNMNSYGTPAYDKNGTVYVPVKLCCGKFGLGYSTISVAGETVLRVTDASAQSDSDFTSSAAAAIERAVNSYYGVPADPGGGNEPSVQPAQPTQPQEPVEPTPPPVEEKPTMKPAGVYLTFFGPVTEHTPDVLDALRDAGRQGTFFLPTDTGAWTDDTVRRIVAEGHTPALLLYIADGDTPEALAAQLGVANERLAFLTGAQARVVSNATGCDKLSTAQRDALAAAGYRLWDSTMDSGDDARRAAYVYASTAQRFAATNSTVVLRLRHGQETGSAVRQLCAYMSRQGIRSLRASYSVTPINTLGDTR